MLAVYPTLQLLEMERMNLLSAILCRWSLFIFSAESPIFNAIPFPFILPFFLIACMPSWTKSLAPFLLKFVSISLSHSLFISLDFTLSISLSFPLCILLSFYFARSRSISLYIFLSITLSFSLHLTLSLPPLHSSSHSPSRSVSLSVSLSHSLSLTLFFSISQPLSIILFFSIYLSLSLSLSLSLWMVQGIVDEGSPSVGILSAVTSAVVVHKVSSQEGIYGMYVIFSLKPTRACTFSSDAISLLHYVIKNFVIQM